jgi:hypothetical protein
MFVGFVGFALIADGLRFASGMGAVMASFSL